MSPVRTGHQSKMMISPASRAFVAGLFVGRYPALRLSPVDRAQAMMFFVHAFPCGSSSPRVIGRRQVDTDCLQEVPAGIADLVVVARVDQACRISARANARRRLRRRSPRSPSATDRRRDAGCRARPRPAYVWTELKIHAAQRQASLKLVVITELVKDGVTIQDVNMVEDGRRLRGVRSVLNRLPTRPISRDLPYGYSTDGRAQHRTQHAWASHLSRGAATARTLFR